VTEVPIKNMYLKEMARGYYLGQIEILKTQKSQLWFLCALILSEILALYKSFTYLLTYLLTYVRYLLKAII